MVALHALLEWPGKSASDGGAIMHPALYHMLDVAAVAECLLPSGMTGSWRQGLVLLVALHDLGKFSPDFRRMLMGQGRQTYRHWEATEFWLLEPEFMSLMLAKLKIDADGYRQLVAAVAGHHGKPPCRDHDELRRFRRFDAEARHAAFGLVEACFTLWPQADLSGVGLGGATRLSWWLAGMTTLCDWVGANRSADRPVPRECWDEPLGSRNVTSPVACSPRVRGCRMDLMSCVKPQVPRELKVKYRTPALPASAATLVLVDNLSLLVRADVWTG